MIKNKPARRKICVVLVDRANYGRLKPVMRAIDEHPQLELQVLAAGAMVLERFGQPVNVVREDGFPVDGEIYLELEGSTPVTMAKSVGFGLVEFAGELNRLKPDVVLLIGDRYEALSAAIAAAYLNLCIAHIQGGEVSGSIDESARHAITKFAHFHFPSTDRSAEYIVRLGERPETILTVGCPSSDIAATLDRQLDGESINRLTNGPPLDLSQPYQLVVFHPTTTEFGGEARQMEELLTALHRLRQPTCMLWPNIDAGSNHVNKAIRRFRDQFAPDWLRTLINLPPENYLRLLGGAACAIGNSSSFVRDAGYFGTPVVLVGNRQEGRETAAHVTRVAASADSIEAAVRKQLERGRYEPSNLYGDGNVSERIAEALADLVPYVQKRLNYVYEDEPASGNGAARGRTSQKQPPQGQGIEACVLSES